jgi:endonuclease/exonuclease/phosphatase family metal-dependent hydrolase
VTHLRVMTYNILLGGRRGEPLHEVVRAVAPDVLLVNECPKNPLVWKRGCHGLAERWGMRYVVGGRPAGSNMIAVSRRVAVKSATQMVLPQPRLQPRRGVAAAQLRVAGRLVGVVSCHLSLDRDRRLHEARRVLAVAQRTRGPVVVGGDLNEPANGPTWELFRETGFVDAGSGNWRTFPSEEPRRRIDALLVRGHARVLERGDAGVDPGLLAAASDHRPVLAELDI